MSSLRSHPWLSPTQSPLKRHVAIRKIHKRTTRRQKQLQNDPQDDPQDDPQETQNPYKTRLNTTTKAGCTNFCSGATCSQI